MAQKKYSKVVKAATAETRSKFGLAEALALDIPPRHPGPQVEDEPVDVYLNEAREAITAAGGEPRTIATLKEYRCTALWVAGGGVSGENPTNFAWFPGASFTAHNEARRHGMTLEAFTALEDKRVDAIRLAAGKAPTGNVSAIEGWPLERRTDVARELLADPAVAAALAPPALEARAPGDEPEVLELYCKYCYRDQPVTPADGVYQCTVCGHGLVPVDQVPLPGEAARLSLVPQFPAGLTAEDAAEAVAAMPPQDRAELAKAALRDEATAERVMSDPKTREGTFRAAMQVSEQEHAARPRPAPRGRTAEDDQDERMDTMAAWAEIREVVGRETVHLQGSELLRSDKAWQGVILGHVGWVRAAMDMIESIVAGGGVTDEALASLLDGGAE
jgi:hypothetical protein